MMLRITTLYQKLGGWPGRLYSLLWRGRCAMCDCEAQLRAVYTRINVTVKPVPVFAAFLVAILSSPFLSAQTNHALGRPVTPSSLHDPLVYPAENAVDGELSDSSRWLAAADPAGNTLVIDLAGPTTLRQAHVYSGYQSQSSSPIDGFGFESWDGFAWQPISGTTVSGDNYFATAYNFDSEVTTDRIRLVITDTDTSRLRDLALWSQPTNLYTGFAGGNRPLWVQQGYLNHAIGKPATASSSLLPDEPRFAVDGVVSSSSKWTSAVGAGESFEIELGASSTIEEAHVYNIIGSSTGIGELLVKFEFAGGSLAPTLGSLASANGITVSNLSTGSLANLFDNGAQDHMRISGDDNTEANTGDALANSAYLSFTVTIPGSVSIDLVSLAADLEVTNAYHYSDAAVFSSVDGFDSVAADTIGSIGLGSNGDLGPVVHTLNLVDPNDHDNGTNPGAGANVTAGDFDDLNDTSITFYIPWIDNSNSDTRYTDLDNLTLSAALVPSSAASSDFHLEAWNGSGWDPVPGASVSGSLDEEHLLTFASPVTTDRVRIINDSTATGDSGRLRIRELALWDQSLPLYTGMTGPGVTDPTTADVPIVALNQIGYQTDAPKRFTAPVAVDGVAFEIASEVDPSSILFSGTITGGRGDFSAFQPETPGPYVLSYTQDGKPKISSYPFLIQEDFIHDKFVRPCIQFMVDSRSGVGTHPSAWGGTPWRDGAYYSFEIPSLIYLHLTAPEVSRSMTSELDYDADKALALDPSYASSTFVETKEDSGFVAALQSYYNNYDAPLPGCPDALEVVHFGLGVTMERPDTLDWSGDPLPRHLHAQTREWFAWFLYTWPALRDHLPDSFYVACRDFTFDNWATSSGLDDSDLSNNQPSPLDVDPLWDPASYFGHDKHPFKGRHSPGHSILPNLMMWQVALREGRGDASTYLAAAQAQTQWIIDHIDWSNPASTKGQRMSEHKLMPGLIHFLRNHPAEAPPGLAAKIEAWADTIIARSDNMWDFRRYELVDAEGDGLIDWTLPKQTFKWNEPGNLAGFPACALSAAWTLDHAPAKQQRLRELSQAAIDCLFGRNPLNTGSASRPQFGFSDQETSWTPLWTGSAGHLDLCRGALASGPGSEHFPYNPEGTKRHPEGWVNFNASLNMGVAYLLADRSADPEPLAASFPLQISEILALPSGDPMAEFIELYNPTNQPVRLTGLTLAGGVSFTVPGGTPDLAPGARCLVVQDVTAFEATHGPGLPVIGTFTGDLDDSGEVLELGDVSGNSFVTIDAATLPGFSGHSNTDGLSGWRLSAQLNGSPGTSDSVTFVGDPAGDVDSDGVPNIVHHAVSGIDRAFVSPQFDLSGPNVVVRVTRNLAADDTALGLEWSTDLNGWQDADSPYSEIPSGDRLTEWSFAIPGDPASLFIRLRAQH